MVTLLTKLFDVKYDDVKLDVKFDVKLVQTVKLKTNSIARERPLGRN